MEAGPAMGAFGIDGAGWLWEYPIMKAAMVDERRRIVMPAECPPHSAVTIQRVDENAWLIRRQVPDRGFKMVAIRAIAKLPDDAAWEQTEAALARSVAGRLPRPER